MDKYSPEELQNIIQQYERSQQQPQQTTCFETTKKPRKPVPKISCYICRVEISRSGLAAHQKSNRHLLMADIQATSQELKNRLDDVRIG